jgi:hypothetical protein
MTMTCLSSVVIHISPMPCQEPRDSFSSLPQPHMWQIVNDKSQSTNVLRTKAAECRVGSLQLDASPLHDRPLIQTGRLGKSTWRDACKRCSSNRCCRRNNTAWMWRGPCCNLTPSWPAPFWTPGEHKACPTGQNRVQAACSLRRSSLH